MVKRLTEFRVIAILVFTAVLSIAVTALTLTLTRPTISDTAVSVWSLTEEKVRYQSLININEATVSQIAMADGVGTATAQKIYDYIRIHGPISDISELDRVEGVGEKRVEALRVIFYAG